MNELDLKTKIEGLEKAIKEHQDFANTYEGQLKATKQALEDYNKPALTPLQHDAIFEAVDKAVETLASVIVITMKLILVLTMMVEYN